MNFHNKYLLKFSLLLVFKGSSRTTRDRAKRDAGGQIQNNLNMLHCTQSSPATFLNTTTTVMTNGLKSRQCQLDMMDTSTESEGESSMMNGGAGGAVMSRKNWSDWCNNQKREKSSQSEDDNNNNNFIGAARVNTSGGGNGVSTTKKRKKLTRKAAIATKGAFAVINVNKENKEEPLVTNNNNTANANRGRKGKLKKGAARGRKSLKIVGLDVLHKQTLLSTSVELLSKKLPPAPGCVDQQLTSLLTGDMSHTELEIPTAPRKTPYALQILLDVLRGQYMNMMENMRTPHYEMQVQDQIKMEQKRKQNLKNRASQLEKQIKVLIDDSVALLRTRMTELGINVSSPNELIAKAKEIVGRHKELQIMAKRIQGQVNACEMEQRQLIKQQMQQMPVCKTKLECLDLCEATAHDLVLKEIANTLTQRKKLYAQVATLQQEAATLERQHNMLINTVTTTTTTAAAAANNTTVNRLTATKSMTTATTSVITTNQQQQQQQNVDNICDNQPLQLTVSHKNKIATPTQTTTTVAPGLKFNNKSPRRQQGRNDVVATQRLRGQEWPDVPDVGKIEESNPEVLAQKILETGRKIEAGKFIPQTQQQQQPTDDKSIIGRKNIFNNNNNKRYPAYQENQQQPQIQRQHIHNHVSSVDNHVYQQQQQYYQQQQQQQQVGSNVCIKESPKVANFEHRLKSIITSVLNEDQEQRKQQLHHNTTSIYNMQSEPQTPKHYATNNVISIKRKHQQQSANIESTSASTSASTTVGNNNQRSSLLLQQTSPTSTNISPFAHGIVTQKHIANKPIHQSQQQQQQHSTATNLTMHHRRRTTITATNLEQYTLQQKQQQQHQQNLEFKAPPHLNHHLTAREHLVEDYKDAIRPPRSNSAHSDTSKATTSCNNNNFSTTNNTLMKIALPAAADLNSIQLSRPNSNSSQPDYTQVSPAKIALRRHLSQEKLHQLQQTPTPTVPGQQQLQQPLQQNSFATKTIGDLVNGEIERTLEISHQSIINAVVNKSTVGNTVQVGNNNNNNSGYERSLINPNAQRPERVNVRLLDDAVTAAVNRHTEQQQNGHNGNLATLAQAAYNHKLMQATTNTVYQQPPLQQQQQPPVQVTISPRPYQTVALPRAEIKGCIEAYFNEDHNLQPKPLQEQYQQQQQQQQPHYTQQKQQQQQQSPNKMIKDQRLNSSTRMNRFNSINNPPLEGKYRIEL